MDPLTQGLLGATIGQAAYGRRLGRSAIVWGALGGMLPDIDVVASAAGPMGEFLYHRGPTHSLWFGPVSGALLGYWLWQHGRQRGAPGTRADWVGLMILAIFTHPLLDLFTTYGTQLLSPLSNHRFALDAVAIIDPIYTLMLVGAVGVGAWRGWGAEASRTCAWVALVLSTAYLFYALALNDSARNRAEEQLIADGVRPTEVSAYPTLLQPWFRRVVARADQGIHVGWISLWQPRPIEWSAFDSNPDPRVARVRQTREGQIFEWFTMGQNAASIVESADGSVVEIDDLRYGIPATPRQGLWALRAELRADGSLVAPPRRIHRELPAPLSVLVQQLLLETFGG